MSRAIKFRVWGKTEKEYIRYPFAWLKAHQEWIKEREQVLSRLYLLRITLAGGDKIDRTNLSNTLNKTIEFIENGEI